MLRDECDVLVNLTVEVFLGSSQLFFLLVVEDNFD